MKRTASVTVWMCLAWLGTVPVKASDAAKAQWSKVEFSLQPRSQEVHPWTVRLDASGSGSYSEVGGGAEQPLNVSPATLERIAQGEHRVNSGRCETRQKNVANTGEKTIRYANGDKDAACTFNFSDDAALMQTVQVFLAIAETVQAGERLQHDLRYDRLALDADMDGLLGSLKSGGAIEVENIAPVLQALANDDRVIDRVRRKAARLLQDAGAAPASSDRASAR